MQAETGTVDFVNIKGQNICVLQLNPIVDYDLITLIVKHNFATISLSLQFVKYESFRDLFTTRSSNLHQSKLPILGSNGLENHWCYAAQPFLSTFPRDTVIRRWTHSL